MANWYTNNVTGNDTTGDGSALNPYKTIAKVYTVCANDDVIYVAGSGTTALPGTATQNSNEILTTTTDLTGLVAVGDVIAFTDDLSYKTYYSSVRAITSTTISMSINMIPFRGRTLTLEKVDTTHYRTTTAGTNLENITTVKTGITISGGWDPTYTTQIGYTWMVYQNTSASTSGSGLNFNAGSAGWNIKLERFGFANVSNPMGTSYLNTNLTIFTGNLINTNSAGYFRGTIKTENLPTFTSISTQGLDKISTDFNLGNGDPSCIFDELVTLNAGRPFACSTSSEGYMYVNNWYTVIGNLFQSYPSISEAVLGNFNRLIVPQVYIFKNAADLGPSPCALNGWSNTSSHGFITIKGIEIYGTGGVNLGLSTSANSPSVLFDIDLGSKNLMDIPWTISGSVVNSYTNGLSKAQAMIKAADGTAVLKGFQLYQTDSTVFDTGSNSLKWSKKANNVVSYPEATGIDTIVIGDFSADNGKTLNIRCKTNAAHTTGLLQFQLISCENGQIISRDPGIGYFGTNWTTYSIPLISSDPEMARIVNRHVQLTLQVNSNAINVNNIWIDSVDLV